MLIDFLLRLTVALLGLVLILAIKKTVVSNQPARRTHVSRTHGESTVWLQRLMEGCMDIWTESGAALAWRQRLEKKVIATLEDRGWASEVVPQLESLGSKPPRITAIHVWNNRSATTTTDTSQPTPPASPTRGGASPAAAAAAVHVGSPCGSLEFEMECEYDGADVNVALSCVLPVRGRSLPLRVAVSDVAFSFHVRGTVTPYEELAAFSPPCSENNNNNNNNRRSSGTQRKGTQGGGVSSSSHGAAGSASPYFLQVEMGFVSEPRYRFRLETMITRYGVENTFLIAWVLEKGLRYWIRKTLLGEGKKDRFGTVAVEEPTVPTTAGDTSASMQEPTGGSPLRGGGGGRGGAGGGGGGLRWRIALPSSLASNAPQWWREGAGPSGSSATVPPSGAASTVGME